MEPAEAAAAAEAQAQPELALKSSIAQAEVGPCRFLTAAIHNCISELSNTAAAALLLLSHLSRPLSSLRPRHGEDSYHADSRLISCCGAFCIGSYEHACSAANWVQFPLFPIRTMWCHIMFMTKQWFMLQKLLQSRWVVQLEQARRWGETYESQDEDDTPDVASPAHSINGSTSGLCEPQPLSLLLQGSMDAFCGCPAAYLPTS